MPWSSEAAGSAVSRFNETMSAIIVSILLPAPIAGASPR
jgi:hypothetical protein